MGRPRKPSAQRSLEGNRSRTDIPPDMALHGVPDCPKRLKGLAAEHFKFLAAEFGTAGSLKRADAPALAKLAALWREFWAAVDDGDRKGICQLSAAWDRSASALGIQVVDRAKIMAMLPGKPDADPTEERFFKVTG